MKGKFVFVLMTLAVLCMPVLGQTTTNNACEIRSSVAGEFSDGTSNLYDDLYGGYDFTWNSQNFIGFYYDIKNDLGREELKFTLYTEDANNVEAPLYKLSGDDPYGITYTTAAQDKAFVRALWGSYRVIGFMGEPYFAGYNQGETEGDGSNIFYARSTDKNSLSSEQLQKILLDSKDEVIVKLDTPLRLAEGYELVINAIDTNGMYLDLTKNGQVVDSKVMSPSGPNRSELDRTYYYKNPQVGEQTNLVTIGVHFKNAMNIQNQTVATVDGIWQISETPTEVKVDTQYDKMTIRTVSADYIVMNNKDNAITLSKNKDIALMPGINIRTADNDTLRFYIYSEKNCECG